jgi:hypothetical protein
LWPVKATHKKTLINARVKTALTLPFNSSDHCMVYASNLF